MEKEFKEKVAMSSWVLVRSRWSEAGGFDWLFRFAGIRRRYAHEGVGCLVKRTLYYQTSEEYHSIICFAWQLFVENHQNVRLAFAGIRRRWTSVEPGNKFLEIWRAATWCFRWGDYIFRPWPLKKLDNLPLKTPERNRTLKRAAWGHWRRPSSATGGGRHMLGGLRKQWTRS